MKKYTLLAFSLIAALFISLMPGAAPANAAIINDCRVEIDLPKSEVLSTAEQTLEVKVDTNNLSCWRLVKVKLTRTSDKSVLGEYSLRSSNTQVQQGFYDLNVPAGKEALQGTYKATVVSAHLQGEWAADNGLGFYTNDIPNVTFKNSSLKVLHGTKANIKTERNLNGVKLTGKVTTFLNKPSYFSEKQQWGAKNAASVQLQKKLAANG